MKSGCVSATPMYTIFGSGFIGKALMARLKQNGLPCRIVSRNTWPESGSDLGRVIFTSGMTSGFRDDPMQTADVHVTYLISALRQFRFERFIYLSSTRLYIHTEYTNEDAPIIVDATDPNDIFTVTKLTAELLVIGRRDPRFRVVRLSNVFGLMDVSNNFLTSLIRDWKEGRPVVIRNSQTSNKDYIHIEDAVSGILSIVDAENTCHQIYNLASGKNTSNAEIASIFREYGCSVRFENEQFTIIFPEINVSRFREEFCEPSRSSFRRDFLEILLQQLQLNKKS